MTIGCTRAASKPQAEAMEPVYLEVRCPAHPIWMQVDTEQYREYTAHGWEGRLLFTHAPDDTALIRQLVDTISYYASVCGEDGQPTPAKTAITAAKKRIGKPT